MEEKINIAELLKDCPRGMELYSPIFGKVYLDKIRPHLAIVVTTDKEQGDFKEEFLYDGRYGMNGECMLFPSKSKTTWEGFIPPCEFKDGDIIADEYGNIAIYKGTMWYNKKLANYYCGYRKLDNKFLPEPKRDGHFGLIEELHYATEEEKSKLFDVIKANGYRWDKETKTLEKLPKFKVGDWYQCIKDFFGKGVTFDKNTAYYCTKEGCLQDEYGCHIAIFKDLYDSFKLWTIQDAKDGDVLCDYIEEYNNPLIFILKKFEHVNFGLVKPSDYSSYCFLSAGDKQRFKEGTYHHKHNIKPATKEQRDFLFQNMKDAGYKWNAETKTLEELVKPKFKVGDNVRHKDDKTVITITGIKDDYYFIQFYNIRRHDYQNEKVLFKDQDIYELVPNKFDINTLKPFDKVLVRTKNFTDAWTIDFYDGYYPNRSNFTPFGVSGGKYFQQCIPYKGNEYLRGTTNDCDDFYKNWK